MFTGLIETTGTLAEVTPREGGCSLTVVAPLVAPELSRGESVAHCGCCLTIEEIKGDRFTVFASDETLGITTLRDLQPGNAINLERSLALGDRMGGHLVTGHVDAVGEILEYSPQGEGWCLRVQFPATLRGLIVEKGSIAVDGISLTCFHVTEDSFEVAIIPETHRITNLHTRKAGGRVNLEGDLIGKYVAQQLALRDDAAPSRVTEALLRESGFLAPDQKVQP